MSVTVDTSKLKEKTEKVRKAIRNILADPSVMAEISSTLEVDIKRQTRSGKDPDGKKYKDLSPQWVKRRQQIVNAKHPAYSKERSNLTLTGELLDALRIFPAEIVGLSRKILYEFKGMHSAYKTKDGKESTKISNEELAEYVQDQGRKIIGVRESLIPRIKRILIAAIRRAPEEFK